MPAPGSGISVAEAARILGVTPKTVHAWVTAGRLTRDTPHARNGLDRGQVEALAAQRWKAPRAGDRPTDSYLVNTVQAAEILGLSRPRVWQLGDAGRLPYLTGPRRVRLYRRHQLQVIANARQHQHPAGRAADQPQPGMRPRNDTTRRVARGPDRSEPGQPAPTGFNA